MTHNIPKSDTKEILRALRLILKPGQVTELRALEAVVGSDPRSQTFSGYFNDPAKLASSAAAIKSAKGIYFIPNIVNPDLLSRAANRLRAAKSGDTTSDNDIVRRRWLLIDCDAKRASGISATNTEHEAAIQKVRDITEFLTMKGWPRSVLGDSGNGGHLLYLIDLPADDGGLVKRCLEALAARFNDACVTIDTGVFNAARIWKLYGTRACKGDSTPERPHRLAKILEAPDTLEVVPIKLLEELAARVPSPIRPEPSRNGQYVVAGGRFDLTAWITQHCPDARPPRTTADGTVWVLPTCPWDPDHTGGCAHVIQRRNGNIGAGCKHNSCQGNGWHDLRDLKEPGWRDRRARPETTAVSVNKKQRLTAIDPYVPFPVESLPEPARAFVVEGARALGCDPAYVALPTLTTLAAAIGNTRRIELKGSWREPCVVWVGITGESGTLKSPAIDLAVARLRRKEAEAFVRYKEELVGYQCDLALYEADYAEWKRKGRMEGEPPPEKPAAPQAQRFLICDVTIEAVADRLQHAPRGLLLTRDELAGWLRGFDQYKGGRGGDVAHWLSIHGARALTLDRKSGNTLIHVPHAAVSICGGIQPGTLRRVLPRDYFENGLAARLLLAMPPARAKRWTEETISEAVEAAMDDIFERLLALDFESDKDGDSRPVDLPLTPEGKAAWIEFYNEHAAQQAELMGDLAAAWSKLEGYAARLALLVHLVRCAANDRTLPSKNRIDDTSVEAAIILTRWFAQEAKRVYALLDDTDDERDERRLIELITRQGGRITAAELRRADRRYRNSVEAAEAALNELVKAKLGQWEAASTTAQGGRPTRAFILSPASLVTETAVSCEAGGSFSDSDTTDKPDISAINDMLTEAQAADEEEYGGEQGTTTWAA